MPGDDFTCLRSVLFVLLDDEVIGHACDVIANHAVARLALVQGPLPRGPAAMPAPRELAENERRALDRRLADIEDPGLRDALRRLGEAVIGSGKS